jgi:hypothetical protein
MKFKINISGDFWPAIVADSLKNADPGVVKI